MEISAIKNASPPSNTSPNRKFFSVPVPLIKHYHKINLCIEQYLKVDRARAAPVPLNDNVELHGPYSDIDNDNFINLKI